MARQPRMALTPNVVLELSDQHQDTHHKFAGG
jgi:hypothetical protein